MERSEQKRRCSILKKRRSRSMSPNSPKEHTVRRASRRISFSGKHNVREFFGNENTAIVWGETYDVSAEKHVLSNEQITLQSTRSNSMSATLQSTRNDSVAMDMSNMTTAKELPIEKTRSSIFLKPTPYPEDQKENIMEVNDSDMELSFLTLQPIKPTALKSIFSTSLRPRLFNFTLKKEESPNVAERTNGSDNMDISGIEPSIQDQEHFVPSNKRQDSKFWLNDKGNHRQTVNQAIDIKLDDTQPMKQSNHSMNKPSSRKTINESFEMSLDATKAPESNAHGHSRRTIHQTEDIELEMNGTTFPVANQNKAANNRNTINETRNLSMANTGDESKIQSSRRSVHQIQDMDLETSTASIMHQSKVVNVSHKTNNEIKITNNKSNITESSVQFQQNEKKKPTTHRQTSHEIHDMSMDTPNNRPKMFETRNLSMANTGDKLKSQSFRRSIHQVQDIVLETSGTATIMHQRNVVNAGDKTINEPQDFSVCGNVIESSVQNQQTEMKKPTAHRQTSHEIQDILLDTTTTTHNRPKNVDTRNMSIALTGNELKCQSSRRSIHQAQDMDLETLETELESPHQVTGRKKFNETRDWSVYDVNNISRANFGCTLTELSVHYLSAETNKPSVRRQTTHQAQDISIDTKNTTSDYNLHELNQSLDMSLEKGAASPPKQYGNSNWHKPSKAVNRMTINDLKEMSFDSNATGKSNVQSRNDKTILSDVSMDLQSTEPHYQHSRKSVICKSPSKNSTKVFDCSFDITKGIDQNPLYLSHHPLHSTKLNDIDCSKFTNIIDFDASIPSANIQNHTKISEETFASEKENQVPVPIKRSVQIFNQSQNRTDHCAYGLDMSDDSPVSTAKKFNLNKTPFYCGLDKENTNYLHGSDSENENLSNDSNDEKQEVAPQRRSTVYLQETINDDSRITAINADDPEPIEISDSSIASNHPVQVAQIDTKKSIEPNEKLNSMKCNSLFQLSSMESPIQIDDSDTEKLSNQLGQIKRLSYGINAMNESHFNFGNNSNNGEESKQLTFIADDADEDQICNTKLDLASSLESSINDLVDRKLSTSFANMSHNFSKFSMRSDKSSIVIPNENTVELEAFKKSNRLRHSNVFGGNAENASMTNSNHGESVAKEAETSMEQINKPVTTQTRNSFGAYNEADETSFLTKRPDKPLSEIKLDFSGYEELIGLSTPMDVINDYNKRMEEINRIDREKAELRRKFENNEISMDQFVSLYDLNNNGEGLVSQNVEAPSWTFLYKNKMDYELEQMREELRRELETRPIEPLLPLIPDIQVLMLNKCRNLKNWIFDDIWFFKGNIHLRNKQFPAFKVCLVYDPKMAQSDCDVYGMLRFKKIIPQFCKFHINERNYAPFKLQVQELKSKLPRTLLPMCETTTKLSEFDENMHEYCVSAQHKVNDLLIFCREMNALIKEENGQIYIMQSMSDFETYEHQDFIIELSDIDTTAWRCVRTHPQRLLNNEIKKLPPGVPFIKELLTNASKYVPWK